jgi:molecular chaperone HtpG
MLLKGVIDCPDLPLNVSRSALQNDGFVKKISDYITKKVADKLIGMCKTDKESYEKYWDDISPFIKYGCLKDTKFCDKMNDYLLFKDIDGKYVTLPELLVPVPKEEEKETEAAVDENGETVEAEVVTDEENADAEGDGDTAEEYQDKRKTVFYVTDMQQQSQYINLFREQGMNAVILDHNIDNSFISQLEQRNQDYKFLRIDADLTETLVEEVSEEDLQAAQEALSTLFKKACGKDKLTVKVEKFKNKDVASMLTVGEEGRRMQEMMKMYNMYGMDASAFGGDETLVLNVGNELVQYLLEHADGEHADMFAQQLYDLACLANKPLAPEAMTAFMARSNQIMMLLTK